MFEMAIKISAIRYSTLWDFFKEHELTHEDYSLKFVEYHPVFRDNSWIVYFKDEAMIRILMSDIKAGKFG